MIKAVRQCLDSVFVLSARNWAWRHAGALRPIVHV